MGLVSGGGGPVAAAPGDTAATGLAAQALDLITIPNADDVRGNVTLPTAVADAVVEWTSSDPDVVSDEANGAIAAGVVTRPPVGAEPATVTLTACATVGDSEACRAFALTVRPAVELAPFSRYGMANFARSNNHAGQQIYMATSVGNDATRWVAVNNGEIVLQSTKGMHAVRDPSIVRAPEGDKFYLVATDLNVNGNAYGWRGWDWAQSGASRYIEVWESTDLRTWSEQRHVLVAPPEAGMTFAPEAIWDPSIGAYVVYWTSSMYPTGSYFTTDRNDPNGRYPLTRNQTLYTTTRDFVTFTPARTMSNRPNHGTLDAVIVKDEADGSYHRLVTDRTSTGPGTTKYVPSCPSEDIYQERATSILAPEDDWELVASCITHSTMNTRYAEAPLLVPANPGDERGSGYYMYVDQQWAGAPSGNYMEQQLHPYWTDDLSSGEWTPIDWGQKPNYNLALGVIRHGSVFALTQAEHAALRGADLSSVSVLTPPTRTTYSVGEALDLTGLVVTADYTDGVRDEELLRGHGGYSVSGYDPTIPGEQTVTVSYTVVDVTKTASFTVDVVGPQVPVTVTAQARCVAGKAYLAVQVRNDHDAPVDVVLATAYGERSVVAVAPGANAFQQFATRAASVPAGTATVRATGTVDGHDVTTIRTTDYLAASCGG
ncbi:immunoglobulin-like domain-containing protein [Micromonospora zingiberis]|uniref:immunoglobulin-like domain-containing protein n=1 Tax=Micromonospora zingiberis TaxID=2053011 RepID=UPI001981246B|nr:immunoglobulin-like domain-containing protein [Micromonospora zingiberis]